MQSKMHKLNSDGSFISQVVLDDKAARRALTEVELRHKEILKLERCLKELHELFLDMARLVEQQVFIVFCHEVQHYLLYHVEFQPGVHLRLIC